MRLPFTILPVVLLVLHQVTCKHIGRKFTYRNGRSGFSPISRSDHSSICDETKAPKKRIVCYYRVEENFRPYDLDPCLCTHIIYSYVAVRENFAFVAGKKGDLKFLGSLKQQNPALKVLVSLRPSEKKFSFEPNATISGSTTGSRKRRNNANSASAIRTRFAKRVRDFIVRHNLDGVDMDWEFFRETDRQSSRRDMLVSVVRTLRSTFRQTLPSLPSPASASSPPPNLLISVTTSKFPRDLTDNYEFANLHKFVDFVNLPAFNFDSQGKTVRHPARLHGISDMENLDSLVDLVLALGLPHEQLTVGFPAHGVLYKLSNTSLTVPGSPALPWNYNDAIISHSKICAVRDNSNWTMVREKDLTAPYIYNKDKWIGFDDEISMKLKAKYIVLRELGGIAFWSPNDDDPTGKCGYGSYPLLQAIRSVLSKPVEAINYNKTSSASNGSATVSGSTKPGDSAPGTSFVAVIEKYGNVERVSEEDYGDTPVALPCSRPGYIKHPKDCSRFYRCVKFEEKETAMNKFQYGCPPGLIFDDVYEICNWPSWSPPCVGSGEIMDIPKKKFTCPSYGYFQDPSNCEYFYYCSDFGKSALQGFEFKCPFDLAFDEEKLLCNWKWLVRGCSEATNPESVDLHNFPHSLLDQASADLDSANQGLEGGLDDLFDRSDDSDKVEFVDDASAAVAAEHREGGYSYSKTAGKKSRKDHSRSIKEQVSDWVGNVGNRVKSMLGYAQKSDKRQDLDPTLIADESMITNWFTSLNPFGGRGGERDFHNHRDPRLHTLHTLPTRVPNLPIFTLPAGPPNAFGRKKEQFISIPIIQVVPENNNILRHNHNLKPRPGKLPLRPSQRPIHHHHHLPHRHPITRPPLNLRTKAYFPTTPLHILLPTAHPVRKAPHISPELIPVPILTVRDPNKKLSASEIQTIQRRPDTLISYKTLNALGSTTPHQVTIVSLKPTKRIPTSRRPVAPRGRPEPEPNKGHRRPRPRPEPEPEPEPRRKRPHHHHPQPQQHQQYIPQQQQQQLLIQHQLQQQLQQQTQAVLPQPSLQHVQHAQVPVAYQPYGQREPSRRPSNGINAQHSHQQPQHAPSRNKIKLSPMDIFKNYDIDIKPLDVHPLYSSGGTLELGDGTGFVPKEPSTRRPFGLPSVGGPFQQNLVKQASSHVLRPIQPPPQQVRPSHPTRHRPPPTQPQHYNYAPPRIAQNQAVYSAPANVNYQPQASSGQVYYQPSPAPAAPHYSRPSNNQNNNYNHNNNNNYHNPQNNQNNYNQNQNVNQAPSGTIIKNGFVPIQPAGSQYSQAYSSQVRPTQQPQNPNQALPSNQRYYSQPYGQGSNSNNNRGTSTTRKVYHSWTQSTTTTTRKPYKYTTNTQHPKTTKSSLVIIPVPDGHPQAENLEDIIALSKEYPHLFPKGMDFNKVTSISRTNNPSVQNKSPYLNGKKNDSSDYLMVVVNDDLDINNNNNRNYRPVTTTAQPDFLYSNTQAPVVIKLDIPEGKPEIVKTIVQKVRESLSQPLKVGVAESPVYGNTVTPAPNAYSNSYVPSEQHIAASSVVSTGVPGVTPEDNYFGNQNIPKSLYESIQQVIAQHLYHQQLQSLSPLSFSSSPLPTTAPPTVVTYLPTTATFAPTTVSPTGAPTTSPPVVLEQIPFNYYHPNQAANETAPGWPYAPPQTWFQHPAYAPYYPQPVYPQYGGNHSNQYYPMPGGYPNYPGFGQPWNAPQANHSGYHWYDWPHVSSSSTPNPTPIDKDNPLINHQMPNSYYTAAPTTSAPTTQYVPTTDISRITTTQRNPPTTVISTTPVITTRRRPTTRTPQTASTTTTTTIHRPSHADYTENPFDLLRNKGEPPQIQVYIVQGPNGPQVQTKTVNNHEGQKQPNVQVYVIDDKGKADKQYNHYNHQQEHQQPTKGPTKSVDSVVSKPSLHNQYYQYSYQSAESVVKTQTTQAPDDAHYLKEDDLQYFRDIEYEDEGQEAYGHGHGTDGRTPYHQYLPASKVHSLQSLYNSNSYPGLRNFTDGSVPESACTRPGLFQHPTDCNKFYECYWDKYINKYTLHLFECPVKLAFDSRIVGCSAPTDPTVCVQY